MQPLLLSSVVIRFCVEAVVAMTEQLTQQAKEEQLNDFAFGPSLVARL